MNLIISRNKKWCALFMAPALILFAVIVVIPMVQSFIYSFYNWNGITTDAFVGLKNYVKLFKSPELSMSIYNSILYSLILTLYQVGLGTVFAFIFVNMKLKGSKLCRNVYFFPVLLSASIVAQLWIWIYHGDFGLINKLAQAMGLSWSQNWLNNKTQALIAVVIAEAWKGMAYHMLLIYSAMKNVNTEYLEASRIDGASSVRQFFSIVLPLTAPTIKVSCLMCLTFGFRAFEMTYLMTGGGPGILTYNLTILMYNSMFKLHDYGYGSATAIVIFGICMLVMLVFSRLTRRFDDIY